ncbi:MAG: hypothetical protein V3R81_09470, partial [Gammaproteobacteria bacterium]
ADVAGGRRHNLFIWEPDNGMQDLGLPGVGDIDINNAGQIAGTISDPNGKSQAFFWDPEDGMQLLGTLDGGESNAYALNNKGQVVGYSGPDRDRAQAFIWDKTNGMRSLTQDKRHYGRAIAINDSGQVLGDLQTDGRPGWSMCYWDSTALPATPVIPEMSPEENPLRGVGLYNNGYVLATTRRRRNGMRWLCLWHKDDGIKWLFPFAHFPGPVAFNDANQFLYSSYSEDRTGPLRRLKSKYFPPYGAHYIWDPKRGKIELNKQVPREMGKLVHVRDINNRGCIVGSIVVGNSGQLLGSGQVLGVLLEPIPERWDK